MITRAGLLAGSTMALASPAAAEDTVRPLDYTPAEFRAARPQADGDDPAHPAPRPAFGAKGSQWITLGTGWADNFTDSVDANGHLAWSTFLVDDVEFALEFAGWHFNQPGDNTGGVSASMVFRWHFINTGNWTIFGDLGIGLLGAFDEVPDGGTSFNFLPRAGAGVTKRLFEDADTRLQLGLRWHHISNARITGDEDNPSRDGAMLYAALIFPF